MFDSGRPVLEVPKDFKQHHCGQRIVIAWNGTLEAARAAFDSLPLLLKTTSDRIRIVCPQAPDKEPKKSPSGADLARTLARHGIEADYRTLQDRIANSGPDILAQCREFEADLLVMGAYGHSRLREYVFGGTTETILNDSQIPLLISR